MRKKIGECLVQAGLITEDDLYAAVESAYSQGWRRMKLYFLTGLPTETDEDTLGIAQLARTCVEIGRRYHRGASVTISGSTAARTYATQRKVDCQASFPAGS